MDRILRLNEVLEITGLRKSTLYRYMAQDQFPRPLKLHTKTGSRGAVGWTETMINEWIKGLGNGYAEKA